MSFARIQYIDRLKGLAIILVVMGHLYNFSYGQSASVWFRVISSFHMPLFMFLSGLVVCKSGCTPDLSLRRLGKKLCMFLMPMLVFGLCFALCYTHIGSLSDFFNMAWQFLMAPAKGGYWYLMSLSIYYVFLQLFRLNRKNTVWEDLVIASVIYVLFLIGWKLTAQAYDPFCLLNSTDFFPFFILGFLSGKYNLISVLKKHSIWVVPSALASYLVLFGSTFDNHVLNTLSERFFIRYFAIIVIVSLFAWREDKASWAERSLGYVGKHTLDVYVLHYFIVYNLNLATLDRWMESNGYVLLSLCVTFLLAIPITAASVVLGQMLHRLKLIDKFVFGRF